MIDLSFLVSDDTEGRSGVSHLLDVHSGLHTASTRWPYGGDSCRGVAILELLFCLYTV